jgi:hypothetical protein
MALDKVIYQTDLQDTLLALTVVAIEMYAENGSANLDHLAGALMLAKVLAISFGLPWSAMAEQIKQSLASDLGGLLDQAGRMILQGQADG